MIRRLATALDKAARAGRHHRAACRSTTPSSASRRTRRTRSSRPRPRGRRELLNEKEEYSYRYSRLKSYSQYLLYDDPAAPRPLGAQVGRLPDRACRSTGGTVKPSYDAYRLPIVVKKRGKGVLIWGRVRPGSGHAIRPAAAQAGRLLRERRQPRSRPTRRLLHAPRARRARATGSSASHARRAAPSSAPAGLRGRSES